MTPPISKGKNQFGRKGKASKTGRRIKQDCTGERGRLGDENGKRKPLRGRVVERVMKSAKNWFCPSPLELLGGS